jgi:hypothetical protein
MCLCFLGYIEHTRIPSASVQLDDDSLMAAVRLLQANWISIQRSSSWLAACLCGFLSGYGPSKKRTWKMLT